MLYLVPTPIGNMKDITLRALEILKDVDYILAEDTRVTGKLLAYHEIKQTLRSFHAHNEHGKVDEVIRDLKSGSSVALVSDAGTPGISDPGFLLARACHENDIEFQCLPGAVALIPALVNSGFPSERFCFEGFLPHKKGRKTRIEKFIDEDRTIILYESTHRILKTIKQLGEILGEDRHLAVSRELTKLHEENIRGTASELLEYYETHSIKGEFVLLISGK
ncbi:MAG: 16S rRNA (cytidine1402-2'-O)-methyltransferase [Patiriisocius sp.]|jgi:16S rRNA (cytidine1402-2'-O)-methyltransferase